MKSTRKLQKYDGENVRIVCVDGQVFEGFISDYVYADDNFNDKEGIIMEPFKSCKGYYGMFIEFNPDEIETIEIIDKTE